MVSWEYDRKRKARAILRLTRDLLAPKDGVPRYSVKWKTLKNYYYDLSPVIETGTYLGESAYFFSQHFGKVISFEPHESLARYNMERFRKTSTIEIINSTSEAGLEKVLSNLSGCVNFWLDGHFSGNGTFGQADISSPIMSELKIIFEWAISSKSNKFRIAVDDARLFTGQQGYPSLFEIANVCVQSNYEIRVLNDMFFINK